jgi:hypothetical protein
MNRMLGKRPAVYDPRTPRLAPLLATHLPDAPVAQNWAPDTTFPIWCNDRLGCCTQVSVASAIRTWTGAAQSPVLLTNAHVVDNYSAASGYVMGQPQTDQGGIEVDVLNHWVTSGYERPGQTRDFLTAFGWVNPKNHDSVRRSIAFLGGLYIGVSLPGVAMTGTDWIVVPNATIAGGHAVFLHGYDADWLYLNSWGERVRMSWGFLDAYADEAYGLVSRENFLDTHGDSPMREGLDALAVELQAARAA